MKVAFIKQKYDVFGPWSSLIWKDSYQKLASIWPGKASLFSMTIALKADWYIVKECNFSDYHYDLFEKVSYFKSIVGRYTQNIFSINEIPFPLTV